MARLRPYLFFNGNCREAIEFYHSTFGGKLELQTVGESPMATSMPPETHKNVLHAALFIKEDFCIFASDSMMGKVDHGGTVSLCFECESKEEIDSLFAKLSEDGKVNHPLSEEFFGTMGDLTDKYGFNWMLEFSAKQ